MDGYIRRQTPEKESLDSSSDSTSDNNVSLQFIALGCKQQLSNMAWLAMQDRDCVAMQQLFILERHLK